VLEGRRCRRLWFQQRAGGVGDAFPKSCFLVVSDGIVGILEIVEHPLDEGGIAFLPLLVRTQLVPHVTFYADGCDFALRGLASPVGIARRAHTHHYEPDDHNLYAPSLHIAYYYGSARPRGPG